MSEEELTWERKGDAPNSYGITGADVVSMSCVVHGDQIIEYRTTVNIAFGVER